MNDRPNRSLFLDEKGLRFSREVKPKRKPGEVEIRVRVAGICETDLQLIKGYMGFQGILGHEFVGVAMDGPFQGKRVVGEINLSCHECTTCQGGYSNHCPHRSVLGIMNHDGAFSDTVFLPPENLHVVPDSIEDERAVFVEPLAAAFQIGRQVDLSNHSSALVIGDGRLAFLIAQALRSASVDVTVMGKHENKLDLFREIGFSTINVNEKNALSPQTLAVDCTGSTTGIPTALRFLAPRGTLVLKTTVNDQSASGLETIVINEINLVGSRCGPFDIALQALENPELETEKLISARYSIEQGMEALEYAAQPGVRKVLLQF